MNLDEVFYTEERISVRVINNHAFIPVSCDVFDFVELENIVKGINSIIYSKYRKKFISIRIKCRTVEGPSLMILLEYAVKYMYLHLPETDICIDFKYNKKFIGNRYLERSLINLKRDRCEWIDKERFLAQIDSKLVNNYYDEKYFRKNVIYCTGNESVISSTSSELEFFFENLKREENFGDKLNDDIVDEIIEIISELCGNANEHTHEDCLVYCSVDKAYDEGKKKNYLLISLTILGFSEFKLYTKLMSNFKENTAVINPNVIRAYENHSKFFNDLYDEEHFFMVSTFQNKVTTRYKEYTGTGGTGLPNFIKNISEKVDEELCYVLSGEKIIYFTNEYLKEKDGIVGFNKECDYVSKVPSAEIISISPFKLQGTLFNTVLLVNNNDIIYSKE